MNDRDIDDIDIEGGEIIETHGMGYWNVYDVRSLDAQTAAVEFEAEIEASIELELDVGEPLV